MKRLLVTAAIPAAALSLLLCPATAAASTSKQALTLTTKHISVGGSLSSTTYGFVDNGTTYMPIWYVSKALQKLGITFTWKSGNWNLIIPSSFHVDLTNLSVPKPSKSSPDSISLNGSVVSRVSGIAHVDPASGGETTFMPIWYVQQALGRVGIESTWDGTNWGMKATPSADSSGPNGSGSSTSGAGSSGSTSSGVVQYGDTGQAVMTVQKDLNALGYNVGAVDGEFGPNTLAEVKAYQSAHGLQPSGIVDASTLAALTADVASHPSTQPPSGGGTRSPNATFPNVDLRFSAPQDISTSAIDNYLQAHSSPMTGLGQSFMEAQNLYGVDANYLVSHAILESNWGKSQIAIAKNNLFGYGAYDSNPGNDAGMFPSNDYAILFQAWEVRNNYLEPGSSNYVSPTLSGMNANYASDTQWANSIGSLMGQFAGYVGSSVNDYQQYTSGQSAPAPQSRTEPVFYMNGASGTAQSNPYYNAVPYYPSMGAGMSDMFFNPLKSGSIGTSVREVQQFLNQQISAGLTVDGQFGTGTTAAVKKFEGQQGLAQDGVWSFSMWQKYIYTAATPTLPVGQAVQIDQIEQGMAGGYVMPWYHIAGFGWIDGQYVKFTNVYRVNVASQTGPNTSIPVYSSSNLTQQIATLHNGDFVVAQSPSATDGMYQIQFSTEVSDSSGSQPAGTPVTGFVSTQNATLTPQQ